MWRKECEGDRGENKEGGGGRMGRGQPTLAPLSKEVGVLLCRSRLGEKNNDKSECKECPHRMTCVWHLHAECHTLTRWRMMVKKCLEDKTGKSTRGFMQKDMWEKSLKDYWETIFRSLMGAHFYNSFGLEYMWMYILCQYDSLLYQWYHESLYQSAHNLISVYIVKPVNILPYVRRKHC